MLPLTWWLHIGVGPWGNLLVCGDLDVYSIDFLTANSNGVYLYQSNRERRVTDGEPVEVERAAVFARRYSAIIVNQRGLDDPLSAAELRSLHDDCLDDSGLLCVYEASDIRPAWLRWPGAARGVAALARMLPRSRVERWRTISYQPWPYESFPPGRYHSNKNVFLFKERLKRRLLRTPLARLLSNSNLWILRKSDRARALSGQLHDRIAELDLPWRGARAEIVKVLYRPGKIILSLTSQGGSRPEFVAVLAFDEISIDQREREQAAMTLLGAEPATAPLIADFHLGTDFGAHRLYLMREIDGITVDVDNRRLPQMTRNAFAVICEIGRAFRRSMPGRLDRLLRDYLESVGDKFPDLADELRPVSDFLGAYRCDGLPVVFMHGDAKLENFVLDDESKVVGVIDFELAEAEGFPLLDTYYLILYNLLMIRHARFDVAYRKLVDDELEAWELAMIERNCELFGIDAHQRETLKLVFFVHHYARRYWVLVRFSESWHEFRATLAIANRLARRLDSAPAGAVSPA